MDFLGIEAGQTFPIAGTENDPLYATEGIAKNQQIFTPVIEIADKNISILGAENANDLSGIYAKSGLTNNEFLTALEIQDLGAGISPKVATSNNFITEDLLTGQAANTPLVGEARHDQIVATLSHQSSQLEAFENFTPEQIQEILRSVGNAIQDIAVRLNSENGIPYLQEGIDEVVNFTEILTDLSKNIIENRIVGTTNVSTGRISQDATFYFQINNNSNNVVGVRVIHDDSNQNINDLVADINQAFRDARLTNFVQAVSRNERIVLRTINLNDQFKIIQTNEVTRNQLGLLENATSEREIFPVRIAGFDVNNNTVTINLNLSKVFERDITLDFQREINTNIGAFTFMGRADGTIEATANLNLDLIIDLNPIGESFILNRTTLLSSLNDGRGISSTEGNDIKIILKDGTVAEVNFDGDTTVGDVIDSLEEHSALRGKVSVKIVQDDTGIAEVDEVGISEKSLRVIDRTTGEGHFNITAIPGHLEGLGLGILGFDSKGRVIGTVIDTVSNNDLTKDTLLVSLNDRTGVGFIKNQDDIEVKLRDGSSFKVNFSITQDSTLNNIIQGINTASNGKVIASISSKLDPLTNRSVGIIKLEDKTTGSNRFTISALNQSFLAEDLGILRSSTNNIIEGKAISQSAIQEPLILSYGTPLWTLNAGRGVRVLANQKDLQFTLKNGETIQLDLDINENTTLGDIINAINTETNGKVIAGLNEDGSGLKLVDNTSGINSFTVTAINSSLAGFDLGIVGLSSPGIINGKAINQGFNGNTKLSEINAGNGVRNSEAELQITLRDGTTFIVDFDLNNQSTIQTIIDTIQNASKDIRENSQPRVLVDIYQDKDNQSQRLVLIDKTTGSGTFRINSINNSTLAQDLGLLVLATDTDTISSPDTNGIIQGKSLHGDSLSDHIFISRNSYISVTGSVTAADLDLNAAFSSFKVGIDNGIANFNFTATGNLQDPILNDLGISLDELLEQPALVLPTPVYTAGGTITLPLEIQGLNQFGLGNPEVVLNLVFQTDSNHLPEVSAGAEVSASLPEIEDKIEALKNFSTDDLLNLAEQAIAFLENPNLSLFNQKVPLLNQSLNELLDFLPPIVDAYNGVKSELENLKSALSTDIDQLEKLLFDSFLLSQVSDLTPTIPEKLQDAFTILETAIQNLPTGLNLITEGIPPELIAAVSQLQAIILTLPSAAISDLKNQLNGTITDFISELESKLRDAIISLPNGNQILDDFEDDKLQLNLAKERLLEIICQPNINLDTFKTAFDELKIALSNLTEYLLDFSVSQAITAFQSIVIELETAAIQEIDEVINRLNPVIDNLPDYIDTSALIASKNKIQNAINNVDYLLLNIGIEDLKAAITNLLGHELFELVNQLETIFSQLMGSFVKDSFNNLLEKIPAIENIEQFLEEIIGINDLDVSLSLTPQSLIVNIDWDTAKTQIVPLDFSLNEPFRNFVSTNASITVQASADIDLDFGIDLLTTPDIYLLPSTQLNLSALFDAQISGTAGINNLIRVTLGPGNISLVDPNNPNQSASFSILLNDENNDGKITFPTDSIEINNSIGTIQGNIPVSATIAGMEMSVGQIVINSTAWTGEVNIDPQIDLNKLNQVNLDLILLQAGVEQFLQVIQKELESNILSKLPIIGDQIAGKTDDFIDYLRRQINQVLNSLPIDSLPQEVSFPIHLQDEFQFSTYFDLELDALKIVDFNLEGGIEVTLGYDIQFTIGVNRSSGFFIQLLPNESELNFDLSIQLADGTKIESKLFFLEVTATNLDERIDGIDYNEDGDINDTTGFNGQLTIDINSPTSQDNKLTLRDLSQINFTGQLTSAGSDNFEFNILLQLTAGLGNKDLPSIATNLGVQWKLIGINTINIDQLSSSFSDPNLTLTAKLYDISLDLGDFIAKAVGPVLKNVDTYLEPIRPVLDFLEAEIPVVSELSQIVGYGKLTVLDALALFGITSIENVINAKKLLRIIRAIDDFVQRIKDFSDDEVMINFGNYDLLNNSLNSINQELTTFNELLATTQTLTSRSANLLQDIKNDLEIEFPIFDNPSSIIGLLFGQNVDLITWDLPDFIAKFEYHQSFPIFPPYPVYALVGGRLTFAVDIFVGLDTRGIQTGKFLNGFYFKDRVNKPELSLIAAFFAALEINIGVAAAGIEGGLQVAFLADLNNPNKDNKVYFDEILRNARRSWMCVFDFKGELAAYLDAYLRIEYRDIVIYNQRYSILYLPLFSFSKACETDIPKSPSGQPETSSTLAHYSTGVGEDEGIAAGTLIIHVGRFAHLRQPGVSADTAEQVYITRLKSGALEVHAPFRSDYRLLSPDPHATGSVQVFGDDPDEAIVTNIYVDLGDGDDLLEIDQLVTADAIVYGGNGDDTILIRTGADPVTGKRFSHYVEGEAGNDRITVSIGDDTVIGGESLAEPTGQDGDDTIVGGGGDDIAIGDNGTIRLLEDGITTRIESIAPSNGGNDIILVAGGNDTVIGGVGNDYINGTENNAGEDILLGDNGRVDAINETIINIISTDYGNGGNDLIAAGTDRDTAMGGAADDIITNTGDTSPDVIYGDQGYWDAVTISATTDPNDGDDRIFTEGGNDTILAGGAKDYVESGNNLDIIFGDHGIVTRNAGVVIRIETSESDSGDNDTLFAGNDDDTVFGGSKNDLITGDTNNNGDDILVGDQGYWNPNVIVSQFDPTSNLDGNDTIYGNGGNDTILGSDGKDYIEGNQGFDIALGDYGIINHTEKIALRINTIGVEKGNDDYIHGGDQNDTLIGGTQNDSLFGGADAGEDILLGDNGTVVNNDGSLESNDIFSHSPLYGGLDRIAGGAGNDTIIGGSGGKDKTDPKATRLTGKSGDGIDGNEGDDIAIGDNASITRNSNEENEKIATTFTNYGGDDYLLGNTGNDSLIAGFGKDSVSGNDGNDIIFGDNATFDYLVDGNTDTLDRVITTDILRGDKDTLTGDGGNDLIFGGTKADIISGGLNNDLIFGDHGKAEGIINLAALPLNQTTPPFSFTAIATQKTDLGGNDTIHGDAGDDIILGQQGSDRLFGDDGDDDIIGGHNLAGGYDGNDEIDGGAGNDAIAGDNASITRRGDIETLLIRRLISQVIYDLNGNLQITPESQPNPTGLAGRNIQLFDHSTTAKTGTYGKDTIAGGANDDLIFGQLGDDIIQGDSSTSRKVSLTLASLEGINDGDDYIEGGGGKDLIFGNLGQDDIIGGSSSLFGTNTTNNRPDAQDTIFGSAGTKVTNNNPGDTSSEVHFRDADVILGDNGNIFRLVNNLGQYLNTFKRITRAFQLLDYTPGSNTGNIGGDDLIHGEAGDDEIHGMTGNDTLFGEGQDDTLYGGVGVDLLDGGTGDNKIIEDDN